MIYISMIASKYVGGIILFILGITYISNIIRLGLSDVVSVSIATIGILAGLSGLCVSLHSSPAISESERSDFLYSSEKFLHSCLLIVQAIAAKYTYHYTVEIEFIKNTTIAKQILEAVFSILLFLLCSFSIYFLFYGFEKLNDLLWDRYLKRLEWQKKK